MDGTQTVKKSDYWAKKSARAAGLARAQKKNNQAAQYYPMVESTTTTAPAAGGGSDGDGVDATAIAVDFAANEEEAAARGTTKAVCLNEKLAAAAAIVSTGNACTNDQDVTSKNMPKENQCAAMIAAEAMSALFAGRGGGQAPINDGTIKVEAKDESKDQPSSKETAIPSASNTSSGALSTPSRKKGLSYASTNSPSRQSKKQKTGGEAVKNGSGVNGCLGGKSTANPPKQGRVVVRGSGRAGPKNVTGEGSHKHNAAHPIPPHAGHYNWAGAGNPYQQHQQHQQHHHHTGYAHAHAHGHAAYSQYPAPLPMTEGHYAANPSAEQTNGKADIGTTTAPVPTVGASYPYSYSHYYPPQGGIAQVPATSPATDNISNLNDNNETDGAPTAKPQQSAAAAPSYQPNHYHQHQQYPSSHAYYYHHHPSYAQHHHHHHYSTAAAAHHQHYHQQQHQQQQWASAQPPRRG